MTRVLVVDDEANSCSPIEDFLRSQGFEVCGALDGAVAIEVGTGFAPDVLLCDWLLRGTLDGIAVARELRALFPGMGIVFMTGFSKEDLRGNLGALAVARILSKPVGLLEIVDAVRAAVAGRE